MYIKWVINIKDNQCLYHLQGHNLQAHRLLNLLRVKKILNLTSQEEADRKLQKNSIAEVETKESKKEHTLLKKKEENVPLDLHKNKKLYIIIQINTKYS